MNCCPVVVLALGNPFRGDDGVGPAIAHRLAARDLAGVAIEAPRDVPAILDLWQGAGLAIVLDAAHSGAPPGTLHRLDGNAGPLAKDLARCSSHGQGLAEALALGEVLDRLPERLVVHAIEGATFAPGAGLSPAVAAAVEVLLERLEDEIGAVAGDGRIEGAGK